jgi:small subunit ribosomal protein S21
VIDERPIDPYDRKPHTPSKINFTAKGNHMPEVIVRKGEPIDRALKRLKSKLDAEGIMDEVRRLRAFETPTQKSRRKAKANAKRAKAKFRFNPA